MKHLLFTRATSIFTELVRSSVSVWSNTTTSGMGRVDVAVTLEIHMQEIGSNVWRDTGYPDRGLSWFCSISPGNGQDSISIRRRSLPSKSLPVHHPSIILIFNSMLSSCWQSSKINNRRKYFVYILRSSSSVIYIIMQQMVGKNCIVFNYQDMLLIWRVKINIIYYYCHHEHHYYR
jgi:hypothetical protein